MERFIRQLFANIYYFEVERFPPGACEFEWWDTFSGKPLTQGTTDVPGTGELQLTVPDLQSDMALKLRAGRK